MCGTFFNGLTLTKGCVGPDVCHTGCTDEACSMCCGTSQCNQPWNNVLIEPQTCQPQIALWCSNRLLTSLAGNETIDCRYSIFNPFVQSVNINERFQNCIIGLIKWKTVSQNYCCQNILVSPNSKYHVYWSTFFNQETICQQTFSYNCKNI